MLRLTASDMIVAVELMHMNVSVRKLESHSLVVSPIVGLE